MMRCETMTSQANLRARPMSSTWTRPRGARPCLQVEENPGEFSALCIEKITKQSVAVARRRAEKCNATRTVATGHVVSMGTVPKSGSTGSVLANQ